MSISQDVRTGPYNPSFYNNPSSLSLDVKPSRILAINRAPLATDGSYLDYYIDTVTGGFYMKDTAGIWNIIYNFNVAPGSGLTDLSNVGGGSEIYTGIINMDIAELRTLTSTGGTITITTDSTPNTLNLEFNNVAGYLTNIANEAGGPGQIANGKTGTIANFKTLTSNGNTITITNNATSVNLESASLAGFINNVVNLVAGDGGLFANITGQTANFKTLNGPDATILISSTLGTVDLRVNPTRLYKDAASFASPNVYVLLLASAGTSYPLALPFIYNGGLVSRGVWTSGVGIIERSSASNAPAPYLYNVQCDLTYSSPSVFPAFIQLRFDLRAITGNITFAGNYTSSSTITLCGSLSGSYFANASINTLCTISDNNPAQFGINVTSNANNVTIVNQSTQVTIVQI